MGVALCVVRKHRRLAGEDRARHAFEVRGGITSYELRVMSYLVAEVRQQTRSHGLLVTSYDPKISQKRIALIKGKL